MSAVEKACESAMTEVTCQVTADGERQRERGLLSHLRMSVNSKVAEIPITLLRNRTLELHILEQAFGKRSALSVTRGGQGLPSSSPREGAG